MGAEAEAGTHRLLQRQLRKSGITTAAPTEAQWRELLVRIDRAYRQADLIASTTGHTLAVSSEEMRGRLDDVQQQSDERVLAEQDRFKLVFGSVPSGLLTFDRGGRIVSVNVQAQRVLGPQHDLIDRHLDEVLVVDDGDGTAHPLITRSDLEDELAQGRFERHDVLLRTHPLGLDDALIDDAHIDDQAIVAQTVTADIVVVPFGVDDAELGGLVMITDNAERERARGWLAWQAAHDPLTGLANRTFVEGRIDTALAQARGTGAWPSVLFLNLDRFKVVNDLLGHAFGDRLLVAAAERLERCVRGSDTVARLGGDEFVILCESGSDAGKAAVLAERMLLALAQPFDLTDGDVSEQISVSASIGVAHAAGAHHSAEALLHDADLAMHRAKQRGRNSYDVADEPLREHAAERAVLERGLRNAIARREISVAYQPVQDTATGELTGFEALARWVHPTLGDVRPNRFVPIAEQAGLIEALGDRMFDLACRDVATWNRERKALGLGAIVVHVNISGRDLQAPSLLDRVRDAMRRHSVLPNWIMLEMTETALLHEPDTMLERLRELKRAGIRIAIDDFGTGTSSLASLRRWPIHMIKIDREFIAEIASSKQDQAIVKAMIDLAHGLNHVVLAEGVETAAELDVLRTLGCGLVQGYLLGMPMPSENALLLATSCRTQTPDRERSASAGTPHLQPLP